MIPPPVSPSKGGAKKNRFLLGCLEEIYKLNLKVLFFFQ